MGLTTKLNSLIDGESLPDSHDFNPRQYLAS
jgi:hypothetical protein